MSSKDDQFKQYHRPLRLIAGSGGDAKGGGDSGASAEEDPDTLQSKSYARIVDVLSEGPIEGWTNPTFPMLDIYLDNTPIQNKNSVNHVGTGRTTNGNTTFRDDTVSFPFVANKPKKSPWVGRWITGTNIPLYTRIVSVEDAHHLTMSAPATATGTGLTWTLGGSMNFKNFQWQFRTGTQNQGALVGFPASEVTTGIGVRVSQGQGGAWEQFINDSQTELDAIRVDIRFPRLQKQDTSTGDVHGTSVRIKMFINGALMTDDTITGKASSPYIRTYKLELAGRVPLNGGWTVSVLRVTANSNSQALQNETWVESYTEIIYGRLRHPNTALVGLRMDAAQFQNIPTRSYHIKGLKVKIPSNYNPITRVYTGIWNGTFTTAWTDNPAWCWYDMATNGRYGLGHLTPEASIDKWTLYTIGQYCDELVNDGKGGLEPRFICNLYMQRSEDAIKVLQDMAGIFRGMLAYINGVVTPVQDKPEASETYRMFSPANVINGVFIYSGVSLRARHNVAVVSYSDLNDAGNIKYEYVEDHDGITKTGGINRLDLTGFGCTSRGQARRIGLWSIYGEKVMTDTVSFSTALEGYMLRPGQLITVQDPFRAGKVLSGRLTAAGSTATHLLLDREIELLGGHNYYVSVLNATGALITKEITTGAGTWTDIDCLTLGFTPDASSLFQIVDALVLEPEQFRVFSAVSKEDNVLEITALQFNPSLYGFVDFDYPLTEPPISQLPGGNRTEPPTNLLLGVIQTIRPGNVIEQAIEATWTQSPDPFFARYRLRFRRNEGNWSALEDELATTFTWHRVVPGEYEIQLRAMNTLGVMSDPLEGDITVTIPPTNITGVAGLELFGQGNNTHFQTRDAHFLWHVVGDQPDGPTFPEGPLEIGVPSAMALAFNVRFYNDDTLLWEDRTVNSEYVYTWEMNRQAAENVYGVGTLPFRIFRCEVRVMFDDNTMSEPARLTVENPLPPAPLNVVVTSGNGFVTLQWTPPNAPDIDHFELFASTDPNDDSPDKVASWDGTSGVYYYPTGGPFYYWMGAVDTFGSVSSNVPAGAPAGGVVQPPVFRPFPGTYRIVVNVTITEAITGTTIYYALVNSGVYPTTWTRYTTPVPMVNGATKTLWAIAVANDNPSNYAWSSGIYTILPTRPSRVEFTPDAGFYTRDWPFGGMDLRMSTETPDAIIFWTNDGTTPAHDANGNPTGTTQVMRVRNRVLFRYLQEGTTTIRAIAYEQSYLFDDSLVATATYTVAVQLGPPCEQPTFDPLPGPGTFPRSVQIETETEGARISYTTDGTLPTRDHGTRVNSGFPITLTASCYLKAIAFRRGREDSTMTIGRYYARLRVPPPTFTPGPGAYTTFPMDVTISVFLAAAQIRYTLDGTIPTAKNGTLIAANSGIVTIPSAGLFLKAIGFKADYDDSQVTTGKYKGKIETPTHTPDSQIYTQGDTLNVDINLTPPGGITVNARYTLDGTKPTKTIGTLITSFPATVGINGGYRELKTLAFQVVGLSGEAWEPSDVKESVYDWIAPTWFGGS